METSYINLIAALSFVIVAIIITVSLFYIEENKKNLYNNKNSMSKEYNNMLDQSMSSDEYIERNNETMNNIMSFVNSNGRLPKGDDLNDTLIRGDDLNGKMLYNNTTLNGKFINNDDLNGMVQIAIRKQPKTIEENDRINFITKCNHVDRELQGLLSKQMILYNKDQKNILMEKRLYINKIRDIVNDLAFTNKKEFEQLYTVLKEIQKDVSNQNTRISDLEKKVSSEEQTKNELTNMLIQRMIHESSKNSLQKPNLSDLLKEELHDKEDGLKLLEKYIIKTIRKQVNKEKEKVSEKTQDMNPVSNIELHRKSELMDIMNQKLISMENLYKNINSNKKKQIVAIVKEPVKEAVRSYIRVEEDKPKCSKKKVIFSKESNDDSFDLSSMNKDMKSSSNFLNGKNSFPDMKVLRKEGEANAYYVTN
jgi:hypothetical protein